MEEIKKDEKGSKTSTKSKTSAKSKSTNSVKTVSKKVNEEKVVSKNKKNENSAVKNEKKVKIKKEEEVIAPKIQTDDMEENEIKEETSIKEIDIKEIQDEIENHNKMSIEENIRIKYGIIPNIIIALLVAVFYIFIQLGYKNIGTINYIVDLKVFSGIFLAVAIYLFEISYKKENTNMLVYGIEMLVMSVFNFSLVYIYYSISSKFEIIVYAFIGVTSVYYVLKSLILYIKKKKQYFFEKSDIKEIISK